MKTQPDKIEELINSSGNTFHFKMLSHLKEMGWKVLIGPYYSDNYTNKPREIDIIAQKYLTSTLPFFDQDSVIGINLFIECKYIKDEKTVFWFHEKDIVKTKALIARDNFGFEGLSTIRDHHYLHNNNYLVAKLFDSLRGKDKGQEAFYKAISQSLNALIYFRDTIGYQAISSESRNIHIYEVEFPIILCNSFDNCYRVNNNGTPTYEKIDNIFQLEVNYAYMDQKGSGRSEFFLIDVVDFESLNTYLALVQRDIDIYFDWISRRS